MSKNPQKGTPGKERLQEMRSNMRASAAKNSANKKEGARVQGSSGKQGQVSETISSKSRNLGKRKVADGAKGYLGSKLGSHVGKVAASRMPGGRQDEARRKDKTQLRDKMRTAISGSRPKAEDYGLSDGEVGQVKKTASKKIGKKAGKKAGTKAGAAAGAKAGSVVPVLGTAAGAAAGAAAGRTAGGMAGKKLGAAGAEMFGRDKAIKKQARKEGKMGQYRAYKRAKRKHRRQQITRPLKSGRERAAGARKGLRRTRRRTLLLVLSLVIIYPILAVGVTAFAAAAPAVAIVANVDKVVDFLGLGGEENEAQLEEFRKAIEENASDEDLEAIKGQEDNLKRALDCALLPPSERNPGENCVEGLLADGSGEGDEGGPWSPVPKSAYWLVPVWQKAAKRYGVPWELLAAINGARTHFGTDTCNTQTVFREEETLAWKEGPFVSEIEKRATVRKKMEIHRTGGIGFYRIPEGTWGSSRVDAGAGNADDYVSCAPKGDTEGEESLDSPSSATPIEEPSTSGGKMVWPTAPKSSIISGFGPRSSPGGIGSTNHQGVDMPVATGTKVVAVLDGKVRMRQVNGGYGNYILLKHGGGIETAYAHLDSYKVSSGDTVRQGQVIALSGNTGASTGPHLHFEVLKSGVAVDPMPYLNGADVASSPFASSSNLLTLNQPRPYVRPQFLEPLESLAEVKDEQLSPGNPHDAVDASFATAKALSRNGAWDQKEWKYNGESNVQCDVPSQEGSITYPPSAPGVGGSSTGSIDSQGLTVKGNPANKVQRKAAYELIAESKKLNAPRRAILAILQGATVESEMGIRGMETSVDADSIGILQGRQMYHSKEDLQSIAYNVRIFMKKSYTSHPSGGAISMAQKHPDWTTGTIATENLGPAEEYRSRYDNWPGVANIRKEAEKWLEAYEGGEVSEDEKKEEKKGDFQYKGKRATDEVSEAVRRTSLQSSDCYVAVVNGWYELIKEYPPEGAVGGDVRNRIVEIARAELGKGVAETSGDNVPRYKEGNKVAVYNINDAWCQAFASRVWYWAGIKKPLIQMGGMTQEDGLSLPSHVDTPTEWGKSTGRYKTDNPLPGDLAIKGSEHVEIVEKVSGGEVISTIGGNTGDSVARNMGDQGYTHFIEPPGADAQGSYQNSAELSVEDAGIAILEGGKSALAGDITSGPAFSTMKAPISAAVYRKNGGPGRWAGDIRAALQKSENNAAFRLWDSLGGVQTAAKKVDAVLRDAGDSATKTSTTKQGCSSCLSVYGQTDWALSDQATWLQGALKSNKGEFKYITDIMKGVSGDDETFGFGEISGAILWKGGWGDNDAGGWARQVGLMKVNGKKRIVAVIAKAESASAAQRKLTDLVKKYAKKPLGSIGGSAESSSGGNQPISGSGTPAIVRKFAKGVADGTGLSPSVVAAWGLEEGGHIANGAMYNFLNIGPGESYPSLQAGIRKTVDLIRARNGFTVDYRIILRSAGKSDRAQIRAIASSRWLTGSEGFSGANREYYKRILSVYRTRVVG